MKLAEANLVPTVKKIPSQNIKLLVKMPQFLRFEPHPFDEISFDDKQQAESKISSVIRWRYKVDDMMQPLLDENGAKIKESNARVVKWSDGSYQILVGDEAYQGDIVPLKNS